MVSFCIYCGLAVEHGHDCPIEEAHKQLMDHDRVCPGNPLVKEIGQLKAEIKNLRRRVAVYEHESATP